MNTDALTALAKNAGYVGAFFLGLSIEAFNILFAFIVVDLITGIVKSYALYGGHSITSRMISAGMLSKISFIIVPLIVVWTGRGVGIDLLPVAQGVLSVFILSEAYSILGNIYSAHTRKETDEFDAISWALGSLRTMLARMIDPNYTRSNNKK